MSKKRHIARVSISETGTVAQIPFTPNSALRENRTGIRKMSPRPKEIMVASREDSKD